MVYFTYFSFFSVHVRSNRQVVIIIISSSLIVVIRSVRAFAEFVGSSL